MPTSERTDKARTRDAAAAAAAAAALAVGGQAGVDAATRPLLDPRRVAQAAVRIVALVMAFLVARRDRDEAFLRAQLAKREGVTPDDIAAVVDEERDRQAEFERRSELRMRAELPVALAIPDPAERERAIQGLMSREATYQRQRSMAMAARAIAAIDRTVLRRESPMGAFWQLDPNVIEHTVGCLVMGGKFWPWAVLDRVHPPRHGGCPCRLRSYGAAIGEGLMRPGAVMDVLDAVRAAEDVVMEMEAVALATPDEELREALVRAGLTTSEMFDSVLADASAR